MTRGLITRIEDNFMIVMTDQMTIDKIKPRINVKVGQRIEFTKRDRYRGFLLFNYKKASSMLALILVLILTSIVAFGQNGSREIYAVVSVDINPSIELNLDQSGMVVGYKSFNKDGQKILSKSLLNQGLEDALSQIILSAQDKGYLVDRDMILISSTVLKTNDARLDSTQDATIEEHIESYMITNKAKYQFVYVEGVERAQNSKPKYSLGRETLNTHVKDHKNINLSTVETLVGEALPRADMNDENPIKIVLDDDSATYDVLTHTKPLIASSMPSTNDILALAKRSMAFETGAQDNIDKRSNHEMLFLEEIHSIKSLPPQASNTAQENINKKSESEDNVVASDKAQPKQENDVPKKDIDIKKEDFEVHSETNKPQSISEVDKPSLPSTASDTAQVSTPDDDESSNSISESYEPSLPTNASDKAEVSKPDDPESSNSTSESDEPSLPSHASDNAEVSKPDDESSRPTSVSDKAQVSKPDGDESSRPTPESDKPSKSPNSNN